MIIDSIVTGLNYGLIALGAAFSFVVGALIATPIIVLVAIIVSKCFGAKGGAENE